MIARGRHTAPAAAPSAVRPLRRLPIRFPTRSVWALVILCLLVAGRFWQHSALPSANFRFEPGVPRHVERVIDGDTHRGRRARAGEADRRRHSRDPASAKSRSSRWVRRRPPSRGASSRTATSSCSSTASAAIATVACWPMSTSTAGCLTKRSSAPVSPGPRPATNSSERWRCGFRRRRTKPARPAGASGVRSPLGNLAARGPRGLSGRGRFGTFANRRTPPGTWRAVMANAAKAKHGIPKRFSNASSIKRFPPTSSTKTIAAWRFATSIRKRRRTCSSSPRPKSLRSPTPASPTRPARLSFARRFETGWQARSHQRLSRGDQLRP